MTIDQIVGSALPKINFTIKMLNLSGGNAILLSYVVAGADQFWQH